ncbi:MAG: acyltransferase family protein [Gemmatimonadales bacterium]
MSTTIQTAGETRDESKARAGRAADAPAPVTAPVAKPLRERLLSLDVFRGLTIAGMLLVNDPGTWSSIYPPLEHAAWTGWTPTDLVFPFFLFIVGITTHLSLTSRRARGDDEAAIRHQIIRRGLLIFLFGFLMNGFPFFTWGSVAGLAHPTFLQRVVDRLLHWRIMGVLQRIGLAYICAALLAQGKSLKRQVITIVVLLYGYWFAMTVLPVPDSGAMGQLVLGDASRTMAAWWDRLLLDWSRFGLGNHTWVNSVTWDPEGLFSTIPAIATTMLGNLAGQWIGTKRPLLDRLGGLFAAGSLGMMAGLMWNWSFPINKSIWTSSYVVFTAGMACVAIATIMWIVDVQGLKRWTKPLVIYGLNPMVAFVGSGVMERCIYSIFTVPYHGKSTALETALYEWGFHSWLDPVNASLGFAISFVLLWFGILYVLYRKQIFFKV